MFKCDYCNTILKTERGYMEHHCEQMRRTEFMNTKEGMLAYQSYNTWMRGQGKREQSAGIFLTSMYFMAFERFANFLVDAKVKSYRGFIGLMISKEIDPKFWTDHRAYSMFIEYHDKVVPIEEQIKISINAMLRVVDEEDEDISNFFTVISNSELISMIQRRELSPWLILRSTKFRIKLRYMTEEQRTIIAQLIRAPLWQIKFKKNPKVLDDINQLVYDLEL